MALASPNNQPPDPTWVSPCGTATLYLGDCLTVLPTLAAGSVGAVVTDPPYGVDFRGESWDTLIPDWLPEARRVAPCVMFTTAPTTMWDYPRPDWVLNWYRPASSARNIFGGFNHWSPVLVYGDADVPVDSINLHAIQHAQPPDFPHPCPKPEALMEWLVPFGSVDGDSILDPFMGSGTTGVACVRTGRKFIGIEIEERYFQIAKRRIEAALRDRENIFPSMRPGVQVQATFGAEARP